MSNKFYAPKQTKGNGSSPATTEAAKSPATTSKLPSVPSACELEHFVRFVLISGAALELNADSIEEVTETWADRCCKAVTGCKRDGTKVAIPVERVDYMEEV